MMERWWALRVPEECAKQVNRLRTWLFRHSGEPTTRALPPVVLLGTTGKEEPPSLVPAPQTGIIAPSSVFTHGMLVLPVTGLETMYGALDIADPISGIYLCSKQVDTEKITLPAITDFRLMRLEISWEPWRVTWTVRSERRLWKGKA
ncbi:MAG: hypothetical protein LKE39_08585 [Sphaerochaeta sp.]|nr:hypothetical protein [Sphaerochaeta sp.]MCH3920503.1 hypothetical protein [Sphaerochaeta sp.]MCI2044983.1 hypothetical protein [Sphaerochaeta sp.]MCI2076352.1 hypothetical protein [Sphaerochaeta sp.]MCI2096905.1 hypothetical protein [Sphaerochaeta sp.]